MRGMTDVTPTRAQRFAAVVGPAAQRAGYTGHGSNARLARDTGMTESSVSRMLKGQAIPDPTFFEPIAAAVGLSTRSLLVEAGIISEQTLTETAPSQVASAPPVTPEDAADGLGIHDPVSRQMLFATIERLRRLENAPEHRRADGAGGIAAEQ